MLKKEIELIKKYMLEYKLDSYVVLTNDYHLSEYLGDFFKERAFLTGFTGSNGDLLITNESTYLWTDGRYFIQAENQLKDTGIKLMKIGEPNVPSLLQLISDKKLRNIGVDLKLCSYGFYERLKKITNEQCKIIDINLVSKVWKERPEISAKPAFLLENQYVGETYQSKFSKILSNLKSKNCKNTLYTKLDDINYLLNVRGNDIESTPYFLSYFLVKNNKSYLYANDIFDQNILNYFKENMIELKPYYEIYNDIKTIEESIILDKNCVNASLICNLKSDVKIINEINIIQKMKAIKNEVEINATKECHIQDGLAIIRIMKYIKESKEELTELKIQYKLDEYRKNLEGFIENSFTTICAYKENAAMMHYSASPETDKVITGDGLLLIDSGGQFLKGTTDITRTFAIGNISDELKKQYTLVLKGMINLSKTRFLKGCRGVNLDILARGPIWNYLLDYKCGTGHGVGHVGSVHEGPNGFRWKIVEERNDSCILEPGMITTNEPGIYIENSHGIRIENELLCKFVAENEYGEFLEFETITMAPIDLDAIDANYLNNDEIDFLNNYHQTVYNKLMPYLEHEEIEFLKKYTKKI